MKEYQVTISRTYTTNITLKFPDDGRNHMDIIDDKIKAGDEDIWDLIAENELEQMDISNQNWMIEEINNTINYISKKLGKNTFDLNNSNDVFILIEGITRFDSGADSLKYYDSNSMSSAVEMFLKNPQKFNKIVPEIKPKPTHQGMMAVN